MKEIVKKIPIIGPLAKVVYFTLVAPFRSFSGSQDYWKDRYSAGGHSGAGSYNKLAEFKAEVLNAFVANNGVQTVIEFGCGDGNQLKIAEYPHYLGFDVSPEAIKLCEQLFPEDPAKSFRLVDDYANDLADLTMSLDVVYHLVEDKVFHEYMEKLFDASKRYVIVFSSNTDKQAWVQAAHVKHRQFSSWVEANRPGWTLVEHIPNRYPYKGDDEEGSFADFYIYEKTTQA